MGESDVLGEVGNSLRPHSYYVHITINVGKVLESTIPCFLWLLREREIWSGLLFYVYQYLTIMTGGDGGFSVNGQSTAQNGEVCSNYHWLQRNGVSICL